MSADSYMTLATAISGFTDQLEVEANLATKQKRQAETIMRQLFPDITDEQASIRLKQFDVMAVERSAILLRLRKLLADIARARSEGRLT